MHGSCLHRIFSAKQHDVEPSYQIGQVADITGATCKAIRHYERIGIIPAPARKGCYRVYSERDVFLVHMIKTAQTLGFSLDEIRELSLAKARDNQFPLSLASQLLDRKKADIREQIDKLHTLEHRIETFRKEMFAIFA